MRVIPRGFPFSFVVCDCIVPLSSIFRKSPAGWQLSKKELRDSTNIYGRFKQYGKDAKEVYSLMLTVGVLAATLAWDSGIENCAVMVMISLRSMAVLVGRQPPPHALRFSHGRGERETSDW